MTKIMFVCLGNICRSPLAEGIANFYVKKYNLDYTISSSGTSNAHEGENPCKNSIKVAKNHGIDISSYKSTQVRKNDFKKYDMIIALDDSNMNDLKSMQCKNLYKLGSFGFNNMDVEDPYYYAGFEGFEKVYDMIDTCVKNILKI